VLIDGYKNLKKVIAALEEDGHEECKRMFEEELLPGFANGPKRLAETLNRPELNTHWVLGRPSFGINFYMGDELHTEVPCSVSGDMIWLPEEELKSWADAHTEDGIPPCMEIRPISMLEAIRPGGALGEEGLDWEEAGVSNIVRMYADYIHDQAVKEEIDNDHPNGPQVIAVAKKFVERMQEEGYIPKDNDLKEYTTKQDTSRMKSKLADIASGPHGGLLKKIGPQVVKEMAEELGMDSKTIEKVVKREGLSDLLGIEDPESTDGKPPKVALTNIPKQ